MLGGDGEVGVVGHVVAPADAVAVDAGDDRLEALLDAGVGVEAARRRAALPLGLLEPLDVAAGAEGALPGAGHDDDADRGVGAGVLHRLSHLPQSIAGEGVHDLGPVDGNPGGALNPVVLLVDDVLEF